MATSIKTAISIDKSLYEKVEMLDKQMNVSRSHLFALAVENFIKSSQSHLLLEQINQAYADQQDASEEKRLSQWRSSHRKLVEGEW